ncbi:MAG: hypothetical protein GKR94_15045 [Gammaproteobacteria bacterium]|nr:hypothetical protein [Gammaproteobacteria bacterium]
MPGGATAVHNGAELRDPVASLGESLGSIAETQVRAGRRIWGARRNIDVVLRHPANPA